MQALTTWVLGEAMAQCAAWRSNGRVLAVSVNVTTTNLLQEGFTDLVVDLLKQNDLPGEALVIEITETSIITDFARSKAVIENLRDHDIVVSIDDFGAGFTSLAYLSSLAVGELKLDRAFITGLGEDGKERDLELVRATGLLHQSTDAREQTGLHVQRSGPGARGLLASQRNIPTATAAIAIVRGGHDLRSRHDLHRRSKPL
jgi:EAL domain-containing protein (putative c-di-GMP-specific phosphodiesterase class I)